MHEETIYSPPRDKTGRRIEEGEYVHVRKPLERLSSSEVGKIIDPVVAEAVRTALDDGNPMKVFADPEKLPVLPNGSRVKKVRIGIKRKVMPIGKGHRQRHVMTGSNHHVEILETSDKKGDIKWVGEVVTLFEAIQRQKRGEPIVKKDHGKEKKFLFSLAGGDAIQLGGDSGDLFRIRMITIDGSSPRLRIVTLREARKLSDLSSTDSPRPVLSGLQKVDASKITISPIGEVLQAND